MTPEENSSKPDEAVEKVVEDYLRRMQEGLTPDLELFLGDVPEALREECRLAIQSAGAVMGALDRVRDVTSEQGEEVRGIQASSLDGDSSIVVGDFRLIRKIGSGGMGTVYEAEQLSLRRRVALKILAPHLSLSTDAIKKFHREAEAGGRQEHPGIVAIHAVGKHEGIYFIAQELVPEGRSLVDWLADRQQGGKVPQGFFREVARLVIQVAEALEHTHESGVIHRDVKPSNILMTRDGRTKVTDFGLARVEDALVLSRTGDLAGTPFYMSPEQAATRRFDIDHRTDIFSLGVTLYEMLTLERPFQGDTSQEVLKKILLHDPRDPRKANPRVPGDLALISLKALEKRPEDRYGTMGDLADDLGRFLSGDVIRARKAGPVKIMRKWVHRNPVKVVGIAAVMVMALVAIGLLVGQKIEQKRVVASHLGKARKYLEASEFDAAKQAVVRAREHNPTSVAAAALRMEIEKAENRALAARRRRRALSDAARARTEARQKFQEYARTRKEIESERMNVRELRVKCMTVFRTRAARGDYARREKELERKEAHVERLLAEGREALERAIRFEAPYHDGRASTDTRTVLADCYMRQFREVLAARGPEAARPLADDVRKYDDTGRHTRELLGLGSLTVTVDPAGAVVYLFRYESYETVRSRPAVVPRLVPVPTRGIGRCRPASWLEKEDFCPGDLCLVITDVTRNSISARSGLQPGDLVIRLNRQPCGGGLFVTGVVSGVPLERSGIRPLTRIAFINGEIVEGYWDLKHANRPRNGKDFISFSGVDAKVQCKRRSIRCSSAMEIIHERSPVAYSLTCLRSGVVSTIQVPEGGVAGIEVQVTAYPLILSHENRITPGKTMDVDPGSYLLLVRSPGKEDQRYPVFVPRTGRSEVKVTLLETGTTPPGFVHVPPGPFLCGGDPELLWNNQRRIVNLPGFFIARNEVTNREWYEFLNDPGVRKHISRPITNPSRLVPREPPQFPRLARWEGDQIIPTTGNLDTPVMGISWNDIQLYLKWRNRKGREAGEKGRYVLATADQWEKAARGVDGRFFPWGNRLDFSLATSPFRKKYPLPVAAGSEPRDESPFGLLDTGGSVYELTGTESPPGSDQYIHRGGSRGEDEPSSWRLAIREDTDHEAVDRSGGFRLVFSPDS